MTKSYYSPVVLEYNRLGLNKPQTVGKIASPFGKCPHYPPFPGIFSFTYVALNFMRFQNLSEP